MTEQIGIATDEDAEAEAALDDLYTFLDQNGAAKRLAYAIDRLVQARVAQALGEERRLRFEAIEALRTDIEDASGIRP